MVDSNLHVVTHEEDGWAIKREGRTDPVSTHSTQRDAIVAALDVAQDEETNVIIHRRDGRIREVKSFNGNGGEEEQKTATPSTTTSRRREEYSPLASLGSRIRWGTVLAGLFTSLATSLALTALGTALALSLASSVTADSLRVFVGTWAMLTLLASLFLGGYVISRLTVGESDVVEPTIYGTLLWALMFTILPLLPLAASDIGFGSFMGQQQQQQTQASSAGLTPDQLMEAGLTEEQAQTVSEMSASQEEVSSVLSDNATEAAWLTFAAMLVSLAASIGGALAGAQTDEDHLLARKRVTA